MNIKYCIECGELLQKINQVRYDCVNGHSFWNNAKAAVAVIVRKDDQILVSKRGREPRKGTYDLPGGFVDPGESVEDAAKREMLEETGLVINGVEIIESYGCDYIENVHVCDLIVWVTSWEGELQPMDDVAELEWQPISFIDTHQFTAPYPGLSQLIRTRMN